MPHATQQHAHLFLSNSWLQLARALMIIPAMELPAADAAAYCAVILQQAEQAGVPLAAILLHLAQPELLLVALQQPPAYAATCLAWRSNVRALAVLQWRNGRAAVHALVESLASAAARAQQGGARLPDSAIVRISAALASLRALLPRPTCAARSEAPSYAEVWTDLIAITSGDAPSCAHTDDSVTATAEGLDAVEAKLQVEDVAVYVTAVHSTLAQAGCLQGSSMWHPSLWNMLAAPPGCAALHRFMRSNRAQQLYAREAVPGDGLLPALLRMLLRPLLLLRSLDDSLMFALRGALPASRRRWLRWLAWLRPWSSGPAARRSMPKSRHVARPATLLDWATSFDPWTVLFTSVAATFAVVRVASRLASAVAAAMSLFQAEHELQAGTSRSQLLPGQQHGLQGGSGQLGHSSQAAGVTGGAQPQAPGRTGTSAPAPSAAPGKRGKRVGKGKKASKARVSAARHPAPDSQHSSADVFADTKPVAPVTSVPPADANAGSASSGGAPAAAAEGSAAPVLPAFDPIARRLTAPQRPVAMPGSVRAACPVPQLRTNASQRHLLSYWHPDLAAQIRAVLPTMLRSPPPPSQGADAASALAPHQLTRLQESSKHGSISKAGDAEAAAGSNTGITLASSDDAAAGEGSGVLIPTCSMLAAGQEGSDAATGGGDARGSGADGAAGTVRDNLGPLAFMSGIRASVTGSTGEADTPHAVAVAPALDLESDDSLSGAHDDACGHAASPEADATAAHSSAAPGRRRAAKRGSGRAGSGGSSAGDRPVELTPAAAAQLRAKLQVYRADESGAAPELFLCPISRELMHNPVLASDGHIYERVQIESWLQRHQTSPMTNMAMAPALAPVLTLRSEIEAFRQRFPHLQSGT